VVEEKRLSLCSAVERLLLSSLFDVEIFFATEQQLSVCFVRLLPKIAPFFLAHQSYLFCSTICMKILYILGSWNFAEVVFLSNLDILIKLYKHVIYGYGAAWSLIALQNLNTNILKLNFKYHTSILICGSQYFLNLAFAMFKISCLF